MAWRREDDGQLRVGILEGEVDVAGGRGAVVGDFALDPDVAELQFDAFADLADQFAHRPDAAEGARFLEAEVKLGREWGGMNHSSKCNHRRWVLPPPAVGPTATCGEALALGPTIRQRREERAIL